MTSVEQTWIRLQTILPNFKLIETNQAKALCPSHDDKSPSLSIRKTEHFIQLNCFAGCTYKEIVAATGMKITDFSNKIKTSTKSPKEVCRYNYQDEKGNTICSVVRYKPKQFRRVRSFEGKEIWNWTGIDPPPYNLPKLKEAISNEQPVFFVEGEKDADNLTKFGFCSSTIAGGAGKWKKYYEKYFKDADLILVPDNDLPGRKGMEKVGIEIFSVVKRLRWLKLPNLPPKGDISDWIEIEKGNSEKFEKVVQETAVDWDSSKLLPFEWTSGIVDEGHSPAGCFDEWPDPEDFNAKLLEELNQKFAIVPTGNKFTIVNETENETMFLAPSDFRLALQNRFATDSSGKFPKQVQVSTWWLTHPERREYKSVDFLPIAETPYGVFNMWKGFAVKPKGGLEDIPLFHELIDEVICSGNEQWALYLWSWLAHMVQFPKEKPGVAIVLRSDAQGVGKSRFAEYVGSLLGRHFRTVTHGRHIHGNFNSHLKDTLMLFGDEAVWGGDRSTESILKQLITEPNMIIEMKGKDVFEVRSYLRLMLATNSEWAAPVSLTDRRYFVLDVSNSRKNDHDFFKKLIDEQNHGGSEALLNALMDFDLSDFEVRNIPETPARLDQKFLSMDMIQKWWVDVLSDENFTIGEKILHIEQDNRVPISDLSTSFDEYAKEHNPRHRLWSVKRFCGQFRKLVSNVEIKRVGSGPREYQFPSLNECQLFFTDKYSLDSDVFEIN